MRWTIQIAATLLLTSLALAQPPTLLADLLTQFDNAHDLAIKERVLSSITTQNPNAGPALLRLAQSTANVDTRWMAMRGMATLRYTACVPFLEESLKHADAYVRANAARALADLGIATAATPLLAMFDREREPPAVEQSSLALWRLNIKRAAPSIRKKIPEFTGQTRSWLIQALGKLGTSADVPFIATYLDDPFMSQYAADAIQDLTGVNFGPHKTGPTSIPTPEALAARAWWLAHKQAWPSCLDCNSK